MGELIFKPYFVQRGHGPHISDTVYSMDENRDTFRSDIRLTDEGVHISETNNIRRFGIRVRWKVDDFGYLFMPADNGGVWYELPSQGVSHLNLNYELAKTRVIRNRNRMERFIQNSWQPSNELRSLYDVSELYFDDASAKQSNPDRCAQLAQKSLQYALLASDLMELEKARDDINRQGYRSDFLFGCDVRGYFQMDKSLFLERYKELFNYATLTHYLIGDIVDFEPEEGKKQYRERDEVLKALLERNILVEGRPLFWTHTWVTPEWLRQKSYAQLLHYLERHVKEVIQHYGDQIKIWEVVNELHDWANELELNHKQSIELTRLVCDVARDTNPNIRLLINNCCPFAEYVQRGKWHERDAKYPQRTPFQFVSQLIEAGVDFDIIGLQLYYTRQIFADAFQIYERYETFGKPVHLAEIGCPSWGIAQEFNEPDRTDFSIEPFEWRRLWDEDLQADWLETAFTYAYSKSYIEAANWYDFVDPWGFLKHGGWLRSKEGDMKHAAIRLRGLQERWKSLSE